MSLPSDPPPAGAYPPFDPRPWYGQRMGTNGMAIAALVCGLTVPPLGLIFGLVALGQIKRSGTGGYGLALAGAIVGGS